MTNTSATGGYLAPSNALPEEDAALDARLQSAIVGITALTGSLVRPRWQAIMPQQPEASTNWCAFGVVSITPDDNAATVHSPAGNGTDKVQRHEEIEVLCSFYGPACFGNAALLRDGVSVAQNREALRSEGLGFVSSSRIAQLPELVNQTWFKRADLTLIFRRQVDRVYPVENVLSAGGTISAQQAAGPIVITENWQTRN